MQLRKPMSKKWIFPKDPTKLPKPMLKSNHPQGIYLEGLTVGISCGDGNWNSWPASVVCLHPPPLSQCLAMRHGSKIISDCGGLWLCYLFGCWWLVILKIDSLHNIMVYNGSRPQDRHTVVGHTQKTRAHNKVNGRSIYNYSMSSSGMLSGSQQHWTQWLILRREEIFLMSSWTLRSQVSHFPRAFFYRYFFRWWEGEWKSILSTFLLSYLALVAASMMITHVWEMMIQ